MKDFLNFTVQLPVVLLMLFSRGGQRRQKLREAAGAATAERATWVYQSLLLKQIGNRRLANDETWLSVKALSRGQGWRV